MSLSQPWLFQSLAKVVQENEIPEITGAKWAVGDHLVQSSLWYRLRFQGAYLSRQASGLWCSKDLATGSESFTFHIGSYPRVLWPPRERLVMSGDNFSCHTKMDGGATDIQWVDTTDALDSTSQQRMVQPKISVVLKLGNLPLRKFCGEEGRSRLG